MARMLLEHLGLLRRVRIAERDPDHEPVELRLGQWIGPLVLGRVLSGDDDERPRQLVLMGVHRHVALLHALEQAGLRLRRGAIDLVDEHHVGEDGAGMELEPALALVEDVGADDVGGQEVRGALDARVIGVERPGERAGERGLAHAGVVLDQHVALGEQGDEDVAHDVVADLDRALDVLPQLGPDLRHGGWIELRNRRHAPMVRRQRNSRSGGVTLVGGGRASSGVCRGYATAPAPLMRPGRATRGRQAKPEPAATSPRPGR